VKLLKERNNNQRVVLFLSEKLHKRNFEYKYNEINYYYLVLTTTENFLGANVFLGLNKTLLLNLNHLLTFVNRGI
jgi:hypothetical protein